MGFSGLFLGLVMGFVCFNLIIFCRSFLRKGDWVVPEAKWWSAIDSLRTINKILGSWREVIPFLDGISS